MDGESHTWWTQTRIYGNSLSARLFEVTAVAQSIDSVAETLLRPWGNAVLSWDAMLL